jgi:hypothetical protein
LYYVLFNLLLLTFIFSILRLYLSTYVNYWFSVFLLNRIFLSIMLFYFFLTFTILNYSLDNSELSLLSTLNYDLLNTNSTSDYFSTQYITNFNSSRLWPSITNSLNLVQVYTYPFIYVFLVVTILSVVYCLSYNVDDLVSFMFYCQLILLAGYALFFYRLYNTFFSVLWIFTRAILFYII